MCRVRNVKPIKLDVEMTEQGFFDNLGVMPRNDDLERVNCDKAGCLGHMMCGWNPCKDIPAFWGMNHKENCNCGYE